MEKTWEMLKEIYESRMRQKKVIPITTGGGPCTDSCFISTLHLVYPLTLSYPIP